MKTKNIFNIAAGLLLTVGAASCSSDYLDLKPEGSLMESQVVDDTQGTILAVHGMCQSMYKQYSSLYDYNWFNGEPWLSMYYGDVMGKDYISLFWFRSYPALVRWDDMNRRGSSGAMVAWSYCYGIIGEANRILGGIAGSDDPEIITGELAFRKAQTLTMRAHAYLRLAQIYGPRWEDRRDSRTGEDKLVICLRLKPGDPEVNKNCPLSGLTAVMDQIYKDLDEALELYAISGKSRVYGWEPDMQIAQGIYARAALVKNDWPTAQKMAHDARQGYTIMTEDEYNAGFAAPTSEWMWHSWDQPQGLYYASFGATYACNGAYPCGWASIGAGAINNELLEEMSTLDARGFHFFAPKNVLGQANKNKFWTSACDASTGNINSSNSALHEDFVKFAKEEYERVGRPNGWDPPYTLPGVPEAYYDYYIGQQVTAQFGAQFKFWGTDNYSASAFPFMRASEMLLIEAEAACHNGQDNVAQKNLDELCEKRIRRYRNTTLTGQDLLDAVKLNRRAELWGEGFSWFDYKRWNETMVRLAWEQNKATSGNWPAAVAGEFTPDLAMGWRWLMPTLEYRYNEDIDQNALEF